MRKVLISVALVTLLTACSEFPGVYKIDIPQGNVVTQEQLNQLEKGMTPNQVQYILGTPLVTDTFSNNRWDYISSLSVAGGDRVQTHITVFFVEGKLDHLEGLPTETVQPAVAPAE
jgi:outer membrane protein assembly factor BamE